MKSHNCLIVNGHSSAGWLNLLRKTIEELGEHVWVRDESVLKTKGSRRYNLVILDPICTTNLTEAITASRRTHPDAPIAVFSADFNWQQGRECYQAGASAYAAKSLDHNAITATLQDALAMGSPA